MVLDDFLVEQLDETTLDRVMAPKVLGAWNLHEETLNERLDLFVMYSSMSSVLGNAGRANYVAGNAFLDGFAAYRRAHGLPALTVSLGCIVGVGFLDRQADIAERLARRGWGKMQPGTALKIIDQLLVEKRVH